MSYSSDIREFKAANDAQPVAEIPAEAASTPEAANYDQPAADGNEPVVQEEGLEPDVEASPEPVLEATNGNAIEAEPLPGTGTEGSRAAAPPASQTLPTEYDEHGAGGDCRQSRRIAPDPSTQRRELLKQDEHGDGSDPQQVHDAADE